ncbi:MAG: hypothetical protein MHM6MM_002133 [Cercozoa sp. M6MM]
MQSIAIPANLSSIVAVEWLEDDTFVVAGDNKVSIFVRAEGSFRQESTFVPPAGSTLLSRCLRRRNERELIVVASTGTSAQVHWLRVDSEDFEGGKRQLVSQASASLHSRVLATAICDDYLVLMDKQEFLNVLRFSDKLANPQRVDMLAVRRGNYIDVALIDTSVDADGAAMTDVDKADGADDATDGADDTTDGADDTTDGVSVGDFTVATLCQSGRLLLLPRSLLSGDAVPLHVAHLSSAPALQLHLSDELLCVSFKNGEHRFLEKSNLMPVFRYTPSSGESSHVALQHRVVAMARHSRDTTPSLLVFRIGHSDFVDGTRVFRLATLPLSSGVVAMAWSHTTPGTLLYASQDTLNLGTLTPNEVAE